MKYQSPFHTLPEDLHKAKKLDRRQLRKVKNRILAELELQDTTVIVLHGIEWDRDKIHKVFDQLGQNDKWFVHKWIYFFPALLNFLEHGNIEIFDELDRLEILFLDNDIRQFIQPYFVEQFDFVFHTALEDGNVGLIKKMLAVAHLLEPQHEASAYRRAYRFFNSWLEKARKLVRKTRRQRLDRYDLDKFISLKALAIWNALPDFFASLRAQYALVLNDLALNLCNTHDLKKDAARVLRMGLQLEIDPHTRDMLVYVNKQVLKLIDENRVMNLKVFRIILLALRILRR